jgi:hypothetical protein
MFVEETRLKVKEILIARGYMPEIKGGNGTTLPIQEELAARLGPAWKTEWVVPVRNHKAHRVAKNLKIDIANPDLKIAVELDGGCHRMRDRRRQDSLKTLYLARKGWFVLRVTNQVAAELCSTSMSKDTLLTSLMEF